MPPKKAPLHLSKCLRAYNKRLNSNHRPSGNSKVRVLFQSTSRLPILHTLFRNYLCQVSMLRLHLFSFLSVYFSLFMSAEPLVIVDFLGHRLASASSLKAQAPTRTAPGPPATSPLASAIKITNHDCLTRPPFLIS